MAVLAVGCSNGDVSVKDRTTVADDSTPDTGDTTDSSSPKTTDSTPTTDPVDRGTIDWGECTDELADDDALQCATLAVPLDYDNPAGDTIDLALVRVPATDERQGAVLFNPGGPGGSGFEPIAVSGSVIQSELGLSNFDLVGFDPRGVDRSGGIKCVDDAFQDAHLYLDDTPDTPEEQALLDEADQGFIDGCKANYGDTLKFYSTANTARDMDSIRAGLGDEQMSFLGISYGTYLGGVYATLFPERVRAMVLDSAYEPNGDTVEQQFLTQLVGFEGAFNDWAAWCRDDATCPFNAADVGARWDALRLQLDATPLIATDGRAANQATLDRATTAALYSKSDWPVLAAALADAAGGNPAGIFSLADNYNGRNEDGTFNTLFQSIGIISCASGISTPPPTDPEALLAKIKEQAPRFGADVTLDDLTDPDGDECEQLTGPVDVVPLDYSGAGPIVVVGGTNDPATPIRWAEEMTAELGSNARMVTFTGEGHGQLLASKCVTAIEAAVLADLTLPDEGTVCDPDPAVEEPAWWGNLDFPAEFSDVVSLPAVEAALGLTESLGFGETRTTSLGFQEASDAFESTLNELGLETAGNQDLGIPDTIETGYFTPEGDLLVVIVMGPGAFDSDDLSSAKASVPADQTVVLYLYLPQ
jgi:pimeloyl-ACP methyl ester carboxylesterase